MQSGLTKNISSGGVLFTAGKEPDIGVSIEYIITLRRARGSERQFALYW